MRLLVLILLLANLAFYVWANYVPEQASPEAHLVAQQINPDAIRILAAAPSGAPAKSEPQKPEPQKLVACVEWSGFNADDAARAQEAVTPLSPGLQITERRLEDAAGWWVFMPPQGSRQAAVQKVEELKRLGIDEYFIVQDDKIGRAHV